MTEEKKPQAKRVTTNWNPILQKWLFQQENNAVLVYWLGNMDL